MHNISIMHVLQCSSKLCCYYFNVRLTKAFTTINNMLEQLSS